MSLLSVHQTAAQALSADTTKFSEPVTFTDPAGVSYLVNCLVADIQNLIDTETQMPINDRQISVVIGDAQRLAEGMDRPRAVHESDSSLPWLVTYGGETWAVFDVRPDRTLKLTTCFLQAYEE